MDQELTPVCKSSESAKTAPIICPNPRTRRTIAHVFSLGVGSKLGETYIRSCDYSSQISHVEARGPRLMQLRIGGLFGR
jgi:hypothetical protein